MTANRIIQHIFQLPDIKQVDEHSIDRIISQYPYFTAARLLLARKQYSEQKNLLAPAVKKAQQFSNNMHYFYRFITTDEAVAAMVAEPEVTFTAPVEEAPVYEAPVEETVVNEAPAYEAPVEATSAYETPAYEAPVQEVSVNEAPAFEAPADEEPAYETPEAVAPLIEESAEITTFTSTDELTVTPDNVTVTPEEPEQTITQAHIKEEEQEKMVPEPIIVASDLPATITGEEVEEPLKIFPLEMPAMDDNTTLTFQPLFSDDYFAYKRLKDPEKADELNEKGKEEMKSFTSWLKDMKSSFADKASKDWYRQQMTASYQDANPEVSEQVEKMAMSSITLNNDMVTETLAEVWAKQRQYNTAILIYQKLSLLNPAKSAYFAQKIKELQILTDKN
jgi:tetratricopeptide (TPR) repeat protein